MNKPFSKKTTIIILIALAFLTAGLAYGLLILSQKDNLSWDSIIRHKESPIVYEELKTDMDTSDWLYFDGIEEYGISFKYPRDWEVRRGLSDLSIGPKNCPNLSKRGYEDVKGTSIWFDFAGTITNDSIKNICDTVEEKGIIIDDVRGVKIKCIDKETGEIEEFVSLEGIKQKTESLYGITRSDCFDKLQGISIFESIVSTLKFH